MDNMIRKWKTDPKVLENQRNRRDAQKNARELNWSKATIVGCCVQLCNQAHFVNNPGAREMVKQLEKDLLKSLQARATALNIKGDYTQLLPFEETRFARRLQRKS